MVEQFRGAGAWKFCLAVVKLANLPAQVKSSCSSIILEIFPFRHFFICFNSNYGFFFFRRTNYGLNLAICKNFSICALTVNKTRNHFFKKRANDETRCYFLYLFFGLDGVTCLTQKLFHIEL